jgi:hypothetical protein
LDKILIGHKLKTILACEQFETEVVVERDLALSEEVLAEKKYKDRGLQSSYRVIYPFHFQ